MKIKKLETKQEFKKAIELYERDTDELLTFDLYEDIDKRWKISEEVLNDLENKYFDLVWYARCNPEKLLQDEIYEGLQQMKRIETTYPDEINIDDFQHGFNSGMLASIRLVKGLMTKQFIEAQEIEISDELYINEKGIAGFIYDGFDDAIENFPELDT